jgi:VWFA-related protein
MIRRACLLSVLAVAGALPLCGAEKAQPAAPLTSFGASVEVNVVNVEVYATDRNGKRVNDLKREDFTVLEDGKRVEVTNFAAFSSGHDVTASAGGSGSTSDAAASAAPAAAAPDPETALSLVVFLDDLHLRPEHRVKAVEQIRAFLSRSVRPGDRVMVAANGFGLHLIQPFTEDRTAVDTALKQAESKAPPGQMGDEARRSAFHTLMAMQSINQCALENVRPVETYAAETREEALRTINALTVTISSLAGVPGHRALLFVSDGISVTPGEELFQVLAELCGGSTEPFEMATGNILKANRAGGDVTGYNPRLAALDAQRYSVAKPLEDLAAHASANRVTLYTLQASGLGFSGAGADQDPEERRLQSTVVHQIQTNNLKGSLTALAIDTGGRAILDVNDFGPELARMQEDFESYYSLGYTTAHHGDGRKHKVEVKVKRPGLRIRYRPSYRDKPALEKAADRMLTALLHGIEDNPLEVAIELGVQTPDPATGVWAVPIRLRIPLDKLAILQQEAGGARQGRLRLLVATRDEKGVTSPVRQAEVPVELSGRDAPSQHYLYTLILKMPAGVQQVAVGVRDEIAATTSYLSRDIIVGAPTAVKAGASHPERHTIEKTILPNAPPRSRD